jgi:hypothetical protein
MLVRVVNDNVHPYTEKYRGRTIHIPPKGFVEMDMNEASHFLGTNPGTAQVDASGIPKPESYKMLRIVRPEDLEAEVAAESKKWICMADGKEFPTQEALEAHVEANYMDDMVDEKAKEKLSAKRAGKKRGLSDTSTNRDGGPA